MLIRRDGGSRKGQNASDLYLIVMLWTGPSLGVLRCKSINIEPRGRTHLRRRDMSLRGDATTIAITAINRRPHAVKGALGASVPTAFIYRQYYWHLDLIRR